MLQTDRRALAEARQRRDEKAFLTERRPVALGVFDQLVGFGEPHRPPAALAPIVEQDAGDLAAFARTGSVTQHPAAPEANSMFAIVGCGRDDIERVVHGPGTGEISGMRLAGIDDAFELGVGEQAIAGDGGRQMRPIAGLGRRNRSHCCRLHQAGRMRRRAQDADGLKRVVLIQRVGDVRALNRRPIDRFISKRRRIRRILLPAAALRALPPSAARRRA